ncbi:MAG: hypothetical protein JSU95_10050 [Betaproteobacteria bacterium]|nr:MAG: hypothetical protein JSU95_10050 [Betaproteobacteria bacterium]
MEPNKQAMAFEEIRSSLEMNDAGRLLLKGQEMVLLPRHFFRYILREVNSHGGEGAFEDIFYKAGFDGAFTFCKRYREINKCSPQQAVEGYLAEMSVRGWGAFDIESFVPDDGILHVVLKGSALVPEGDLPSGHLIWKGAMVGAVRSLPNITERTVLAATMEETADGCKITVRPE